MTDQPLSSNSRKGAAVRRRLLLLDIRPHTEYQQRNLVAVTNHYNQEKHKNVDSTPEPQIVYVHIPFDEVIHRKFELPPRQIPFAIVSSFPEEDWLSHWNDIQAMLSSSLSSSTSSGPSSKKKDGTTSTSLDHSAKKHATISRTHPSWNVIALFNANNNTLWESVRTTVARTGATEENVREDPGENTTSDTFTLSVPLPRLWSPDPMIEHVLLPLLQQKVRSLHQQPEPQQRVMEIWDMGSGLGRDVSFLAEELLYHHNNNAPPHTSDGSKIPPTAPEPRRFRIVGYDQRYRRMGSGNDTIEFWNRRLVANVTKCYCCDINYFPTTHRISWRRRSTGHPESGGATTTAVTDRKTSFIGCIYAVRYWNKPFFQSLIEAGCRNVNDPNDDEDDTWILETGTIIAISQFGKASAHATWDFPHPKEQHVLERDELRIMFTTTTTTTISNDAPMQQQHEPSNTKEMHNTCQDGPPPKRSWKILHDEVVRDSDYGRTLIQFVAQLE